MLTALGLECSGDVDRKMIYLQHSGAAKKLAGPECEPRAVLSRWQSILWQASDVSWASGPASYLAIIRAA